MPFSREQLDRVQAGVRRALASGRLNDWERRFLTDMQARLARDGTRTTLSDKQYRKLMQLSGGTGSGADQRPRASVRETKPRPRPPRPRVSPMVRPRPRRRRRSVRGQLRQVVIVLVLILGGMSALLGGFETGGSPSLPVTDTPRTLSVSQITVVDGDTIRVAGTRQPIRLVGFNTPETFEPRCDAGLDLGRAATARLTELVQTGSARELTVVPCACPPGTQGTRDCNYGRACGHLRVDGNDVGAVLIAEGLAARFVCGRTSCPPTPRPWCN